MRAAVWPGGRRSCSASRSPGCSAPSRGCWPWAPLGRSARPCSCRGWRSSRPSSGRPLADSPASRRPASTWRTPSWSGSPTTRRRCCSAWSRSSVSVSRPATPLVASRRMRWSCRRRAPCSGHSHELRTPLTSVSGFLELLGDEEDSLPLTGRTYLTAARRGTARLHRIVEDLLLVAQIEADLLELHPELIDLAELAADAVEEASAAAAEKRVAISLDTDGPLLLEADAARLRQVLDNLLSN